MDPRGLLIRWGLRLSEYDFEVNFNKGEANTQADALSCLSPDCETVPDENNDIPAFNIEQCDSQLNSSNNEEEEDFTEIAYA